MVNNLVGKNPMGEARTLVFVWTDFEDAHRQIYFWVPIPCRLALIRSTPLSGSKWQNLVAPRRVGFDSYHLLGTNEGQTKAPLLKTHTEQQKAWISNMNSSVTCIANGVPFKPRYPTSTPFDGYQKSIPLPGHVDLSSSLTPAIQGVLWVGITTVWAISAEIDGPRVDPLLSVFFLG